MDIFRRNFCILGMLAVFISIILLAASGDNVGGALIAIGAFILIFGLVAAFNTEKFKTITVEPSIIESTEEPSAPTNDVTTKED